MTDQGSELNEPISSSGIVSPNGTDASKQVGSDEWIGAKGFDLTDVVGGCVVTTASAAFSCVLLVINGAFIMALLSVVAGSGQSWITNEKLSQFLLFSCPVLLLFIQWWLIDTLRWILRKRNA